MAPSQQLTGHLWPFPCTRQSMIAALALWLATGLDPPTIFERFTKEVDRRLTLPAEEQEFYRQLIIPLDEPQYIAVIDRNPHVQALLLYFFTNESDALFIGATPVSTGLPGAFEHFTTPTGFFLHDPLNPDYRALGTRNQQGIRGYGCQGLRVFDFGWVKATKGWGDRRESLMRLQMHSTDPDRLEPRLGRALSKGCIRIPASLNVFLDRYGLLDAAYLGAAQVLRADREPASWPGRYVLVIDSARTQRPAWSPLPR